MKILLKDPMKVEAVIKKITDKFPCEDDTFEKCYVSYIKALLYGGRTIILDVEYIYSNNIKDIASLIGYTIVDNLPTDTEFLNDTEW